MKKVLGIISSPRNLGNCEIFVKEVYRNLKEQYDELKLMALPKFDILPCKACYQCLFGEQKCIQEDDFPLALEAVVDADAYIIAVPTYLLSANSCLKRFLDRGLAFYAHLDKLWKKPAVGIVIAGFPGLEGYTKLCLQSFARLLMADLHGVEVAYAALPGEIFLDEGNKQLAAKLAKKLVEGCPPSLSEAAVCPLCGGDTFRFLDDRNIRCMLCSGAGTYSFRNGRLMIDIHPNEHDLFLTYEGVQNHIELIRSMKERFMSIRQDLKNITKGYSKEGAWVRSQAKTSDG